MDPGLVDKVAALAKLGLRTDERALFAPQLSSILTYFESLPPAQEPAGRASTDSPESSTGPGARSFGPLRPDQPRDEAPVGALPRERLLPSTRDSEDGLLDVPRILD